MVIGGIMRKLLSIILLSVLLLACSTLSNLSEGAAAPDANATENDTADTPRESGDTPPTVTSLPPTWTPVPVIQSGHLAGPAVRTPEPPVETVNYVVRRGDTLAEISQQFGVSLTEVARINNITNWDHIEVGQVLLIPTSSD